MNMRELVIQELKKIQDEDGVQWYNQRCTYTQIDYERKSDRELLFQLMEIILEDTA